MAITNINTLETVFGNTLHTIVINEETFSFNYELFTQNYKKYMLPRYYVHISVLNKFKSSITLFRILFVTKGLGYLYREWLGYLYREELGYLYREELGYLYKEKSLAEN